MNQNQECDCSRVQRGASDGQSMGGSAVPSAAPPASSLTDQGDHVMSEQMPNQQPPQVDQSDASAGGGDSIPTLDPESARPPGQSVPGSTASGFRRCGPSTRIGTPGFILQASDGASWQTTRTA